MSLYKIYNNSRNYKYKNKIRYKNSRISNNNNNFSSNKHSNKHNRVANTHVLLQLNSHLTAQLTIGKI